MQLNDLLDLIRNNELTQIKEELKNSNISEYINVKNQHGFTPLGISLWYGYLDIAELLLEYGADLKIGSVQLAAARKIECLKFLEKYNALEINNQENEGRYTLLQQCFNINEGFFGTANEEVIPERLEEAKYLLENGANVDAQNQFGRTAIMGASTYEDLSFMKLLLEYKPNLNIKDEEGKLVTDYALLESTKNILEEYIKYENF